MSKRLVATFLLAIFALPAMAAEPITVSVEGIDRRGHLDKRYAQCIATLDGKSTRGENLRPTVSWSGVPDGARSFAIVVHDPDVPADLSIANQADLLIAEDMPRQTFYHWVQFNITPEVREVPGGRKPPGFGRAAANDVSRGTDVYGYGGPCPPWNDAQVHRYHFTVHALDVAKLRPAEDASARDVVALIEKHSIARGTTTARFTLNPKLRKGL
jgi:Raf kinase inhibitor-like YbhB/YbcL family protein